MAQRKTKKGTIRQARKTKAEKITYYSWVKDKKFKENFNNINQPRGKLN